MRIPLLVLLLLLGASSSFESCSTWTVGGVASSFCPSSPCSFAFASSPVSLTEAAALGDVEALGEDDLGEDDLGLKLARFAAVVVAVRGALLPAAAVVPTVDFLAVVAVVGVYALRNM